MSGTPDRQEWRYLQIALGILALIAVAEIAGWKAHDMAHPRPTRLERFSFA